MLRLIKKSIFVLKNYGLKVFLIKATKWPINRINLFKQRLNEEKAKKNPEKVIEKLKEFKSEDPEEIFNFSYKLGPLRPPALYSLLDIYQIKEDKECVKKLTVKF